MAKRDVVRMVLQGRRPPYVPWSMGFTKEAKEKLQRYYGCDDIEGPLDNHLLKVPPGLAFSGVVEFLKEDCPHSVEQLEARQESRRSQYLQYVFPRIWPRTQTL